MRFNEVNNKNRLNKARDGLSLQNIRKMEGKAFWLRWLTKQLHLDMCYAIQCHALNETDMSSSIWN